MYIKYIDNNLNKVIENLDSVLYFKPYTIGKKRALFAVVKEEEGVYKKVQITKEKSKWNFPFEPIYWLFIGPGYLCRKDFLSLENWMALNTIHLDGFKYEKLDENKIGIFATFDDGSAVFWEWATEKKFKKQNGIEQYIDLLKEVKEYNPQHDNYKNIEWNSCDDETFIIPELQKKAEPAKVKKLIKDSKK